MAEKNPFSAVGAAVELQARKGKVGEAIDKADPKGKQKPAPKKARKKGPAPLSEIKKTKHKGTEGETSFGQKMKESPMGKTKTRFSGEYE